MYNRRDLVRIYLGAQVRGFGGYHPESSTFNAALKAHYAAMLDGLQQLFGLHLHPDGVGTFNNRVLFSLFPRRPTRFSPYALRGPVSWRRAS